MNNVRHTVLVLGLLTSLVLLPTTSRAQEHPRVTGLRTRVADDETYRNRFIGSSVFIGLLVVAGLYVLTKPHQPGPRPRSG